MKTENENEKQPAAEDQAVRMGRGPEAVFSCMAREQRIRIANFSILKLGIDIGTHSIKVVGMRKSLRSEKLVLARIVEIYPDGKPPSEELESVFPEQQLDALRRALEGINVNKYRVIASIGSSDVLVRQIQLPIMDQRKLDSTIVWEAKRHLPYDPEEMAFTTSVVKEDNGNGKMDVLLVATKKNALENFKSFLGSADIVPDVVDAAPLALINAVKYFQKRADEESIALLDIGDSATTITITSPGGPVFSRTFSVSGITFTNILKNKLNISYAQAEIIKKGDAAVFETIRDTLDKLISNIHQTFIYYASIGGRKTVDRMIVSGGSAFLPKLVNYLSTEMVVETGIVTPLRHMAFAGEIEHQRKAINLVSPQLTQAIGLALR